MIDFDAEFDQLLATAQLNDANAMQIKVWAGSTTVISVTGTTVDLSLAPLATISIWDPVTDQYVVNDHFINGKTPPSQDGSSCGRAFPETTIFVKNVVAWPGTILPPLAAVSLGSGNRIGPGHIEGSLIAGQ